ncbi:hypothetical protein GETHLI_16360 [Geothrix limicola]|uniref:Uncharacterized protein n=1 Tax=Geothrix limicola TaxID=2927978 RepID=A0ABQ5QE63_9BACT|nr:hypothetical protein [Geothrix limicola]GLH73134.1 hypothetical protein GETHLI_16360 [Geothrix limicola]
MMPRSNRAWILSVLLLGVCPGRAQGLAPMATPVPAAADKYWGRLRTLVSFLVTDEGTRKVFASHRGLGDSFGSEEHFAYFVAPWRPRLSALPANRQEAGGVELETLQKADGTTTCLMTFHHQEPAHAITILKTVWMDDTLLKVSFMKGFAEIPDDNAARNRQYAREEAYRQYYRPAPARK